MSPYKGSQRCVLEFLVSTNYLLQLNTLLTPTGATVDIHDKWMPKGIHSDKEAELKDFLKAHFSKTLGDDIKTWWLAAASTNSRTPNWDLASTCTINNQKGLVLVEAKAHVGELDNESKGKQLSKGASLNSIANHDRIGKAINEANTAINKKIKGVSISRERCYQLSNRVAHAWWLANHGIPVVLLYLGYLKAEDMRNGHNVIFDKPADWEGCFINHAHKVGVDNIVDKWVGCGVSSFITIYRSL